MKSTTFLAIAALLAFCLTDALLLEKRDNPAAVAFSLQQVPGTAASRKLRRHKRSIDATLNNKDLVWTVSLSLGTPPQKVQVQLDTGSSDLVVETDSSDICQSQPTICSGNGACEHSPSCVRSKLTKDR
jgi:hypothetical protein